MTRPPSATRVSGADEYVGIAVASVAVSVTDNDRATTLSVNSPSVNEGDTGTTTPMTFTFTLNQFSTQTVTARITIGIPGQTAGSPDDYELTTNSIFTMSFAPGETTKTLVLTVKGDDLAEPDETVIIAVSHLTNVVFGSGFGPHSLPGNMVATGTIVDDDSSENRRASVTVNADDPVAVNEGGSATYTVVLDGQPTANVVIAMSSDNADVTAQPASLTFTPDNWQTAQTVTVRAAQDDDAADDKATISHAVSGSDEYTGIAVAPVNVAVTDDDTAGVTVSETDLSINEGESATYTVVLDTQPIADVGISPFALGGNFKTQQDRLVFTPDNWRTPQTVTVTAPQDDDADDEQGTIAHGPDAPAESAYADVEIAFVNVSVTDDDPAGQPAQPSRRTTRPWPKPAPTKPSMPGLRCPWTAAAAATRTGRPDLRLDADLGPERIVV